MLNEVLRINKRMTFREVFHKIIQTANEMLIVDFTIKDRIINYSLISVDNEVSINIILDSEATVFLDIDKIILSFKENDRELINEIKKEWKGRVDEMQV